MGENTKIEWCDMTFNPWRGCSRVSTGCINCYAERYSKRNPTVLGEWGTGKRVIASESYWEKPLRWDRRAQREGRRYRVFCGSMMDVFEDRPELEEPRQRLIELIEITFNLDWLLLTKRPKNAIHLWKKSTRWDLRNVWMGVSVENQAAADERIPLLLQIPATVRFLSCEPVLGQIDLSYAAFNGADSLGSLEGIHWVIVGGESGQKARPMNPDWVRRLHDQCKIAGMPFFFKQWGEWYPVMGGFERYGKKAAGRLLDGRTWGEVPTCYGQ